MAGRGKAKIKVKIVRMAHAKELPLPAYQTAGAVGLDLVAAIEKTVTLKPGARAMVATGLMIELPKGYEAQIRPRSGLAAKHGVTVLNSPGTIDADYRGEIQVILINHGNKAVKIARGERIAQMVIAAVVQVALVESKALRESARGAGGFGSTGRRTRSTVRAASLRQRGRPLRR